MFASDQEGKRRKRVQTLMNLRALAMEQGIDPTPITEDISRLKVTTSPS
jgi:hypothetical protein